jgi:hypothetical protein
MTTYGKIFWRDMAERVISTYAATFLSAMAAAQFTDAATLRAVAVSAAFAAVPAALSALKAFIAERIPGTVSPASLARR